MAKSENDTNDALTRDDLRNLLSALSAAIELDQLRVDKIPALKFSPRYDDAMWRHWRADHVFLVQELVLSVQWVTQAALDELTAVARSRDPAQVGRVVIELLAEAVSDGRSELREAATFFDQLIQGALLKAGTRCTQLDAKSSAERWFAVVDPLHIADDPECGYGEPSGLVN
jgi:hypothetical protein